jgi:hypothetical protein
MGEFEREVTGERIRDKIAASKAKGIWMGGMVPLGYDVQGRQLIVNEAEAQQVRQIFHRYLELRSVTSLRTELNRSGARSKSWVSRRGRVMGGVTMSCGALFFMLRNPLFLGLPGARHPARDHAGTPAGALDHAEHFGRRSTAVLGAAT